MKGLESIAGIVARRLREHGCVTRDHQLKQDPATIAILEAYPVWLLVYSAEPFRAHYINRNMADFLEVPAGFIKTTNEYKTVNNCDITTACNRIQTYEYYFGGGTESKEHISTILSPADVPVIVNDLASPIIIDDEGKTRCYAHFHRERNRPSIVNAYALGDLDRLTPKQRQVMHCLLQEWSIPRMIDHLGIAQKTLDKHIAAILSLTGQPHVVALVEKCSLSD